MRKDKLIAKFTSHHAHVAIIGLGYVGLPLAVSFAQAGYEVTGIDLDPRKVDAINQGESYIEDVPAATVASLVGVTEPAMATFADLLSLTVVQHNSSGSHTQPGFRSGSVCATSDFSALASCDAVSICVPTPLNKTGDPDISYIVNATEQIARYLHRAW